MTLPLADCTSHPFRTALRARARAREGGAPADGSILRRARASEAIEPPDRRLQRPELRRAARKPAPPLEILWGGPAPRGRPAPKRAPAAGGAPPPPPSLALHPAGAPPPPPTLA